jgi:hypothetical protein
MSGPIDVPSAVDAIASVLADKQIRHAFGGALAQNYWGTVRATQDVDVLALIPAVRSQEIANALTERGFCFRDAAGCEQPISVQGMRDSSREIGLFAVWLGEVKVEVFTPVIPLQDRILERALPMPWQDRTIPVTTAEDLIVLKMIFHRGKDLRDIRAMVATSGTRLDRTYIMEHARAVLEDTRVEELRGLLQGSS